MRKAGRRVGRAEPVRRHAASGNNAPALCERTEVTPLCCGNAADIPIAFRTAMPYMPSMQTVIETEAYLRAAKDAGDVCG